MFSYHSCNNRSCPKCHTAQTQEWLERRQAEMLPVPYFHITVTVPAELRAVLRANQRDGYGVLMQASAAAIIELARDPRYVGGTVARARRAAHLDPAAALPPACALPGQRRRDLRGRQHLASGAAEASSCRIKALAKLVRGKFRALLRQKASGSRHPRRGLAQALDPPRHRLGQRRDRRCSTTSPATSFASLSPTPASSASTTKRSPSNTRNARPAVQRTCRLSGEEFMRRFLQHVLPRGFHKVRYFGLWHPTQRHNAARVRQMLQLQAPPMPT